MEFSCVFSVRDIKISREFYESIFDLKVATDYGKNIVFDCGLSLQQDFDLMTGISKEDITIKSNNCELYFESVDFDSFVNELRLRRDIELLHDIVEQPWGQRVVRFYDPDKHLIEVGENMKIVVKNFLTNGLNIDLIAEKMDITNNEVQKILNS